jgi:hypothetical protein
MFCGHFMVLSSSRLTIMTGVLRVSERVEPSATARFYVTIFRVCLITISLFQPEFLPLTLFLKQ